LNTFVVKIHTITCCAYLNFQNKSINPFSNASIKIVVLATLLFFVDIDEDLIMANDVTTFSNPLVTLVQNEDDDVRLFSWTWVPSNGHYHWLKGPINPLLMEHKAKYLVRTIRRLIELL
jgi:hypothetical protein